jgi:hypothetical protein
MSFHFQTSRKLANMNVTTFRSLLFDSKHFKHSMNAIKEKKGGGVQSEVPQQCELTSFQLHVTWKLTALSLQENTFQKPWNLASAFHFNYSCPYDYTSGLKTCAAKFLADLPLGWVNCN